MIIQSYKFSVNPFFRLPTGIQNTKNFFSADSRGANLTMLICEEQVSTIC